MTFNLHTLPAGKGSRTVGRRKNGSIFTRPDNPRQMPFADAVAAAAVAAGVRLSNAQQGLSVVWYAPRPKSHFNAAGELRRFMPMRPLVADGDKVLRNIADALEGIAWRNDRAVRPMSIDCHFAEQVLVVITIFDCPPEGHWSYVTKGKR